MALRPECWRENASGKTTISFDEKENALCVRNQFSATNHWTYPELLAAKGGFSFAGAVAIEFEIKTEQTRENASRTTLCYFRLKNGKLKRVNCPVSYGEWVPCRIKFPVPGEEITGLQIGMNPRAESVTFMIRGLKLVKP